MTKLINNPNSVENDLFSAFASLYHDAIYRIEDTGVFVSKEKYDSVAVVSGGGSGHEPAHIGYVGSGMLKACAMGAVFVPPTPDEVYQMICAADEGKGVFVIVKNFIEDVTSFNLGIDMARQQGIKVDSIIVNDDCSVEDSSFKKRRRGVAGTLFIHKIIGAAAQAGKSLDELKVIAESALSELNTLGVALSSGTLPGKATPMFDLEFGHVSYGMGIHGESGYRIEDFRGSAELANEIWNKLKSQCDVKKGEQVAILVNGLGGTPEMELLIFYHDLMQLIELDNIECSFVKVGSLMTSMDMKGVSVSCLPLKESMWLEYLNQKTNAPSW